MAGKTGITIKIVSNKLPDIPAQLRELVAQEVEKAAFDIEARAKALAPVKTGLLRRSIHTVVADGGLSATVGPSVSYAAPVEFGTRHMSARPYMRPAAEAVLPGFAARIKAILAGLGSGSGGGGRSRSSGGLGSIASAGLSALARGAGVPRLPTNPLTGAIRRARSANPITRARSRVRAATNLRRTVRRLRPR